MKTVTLNKRTFFSTSVVNPYLYQFDVDGVPIHEAIGDDAVPSKFLRIPGTKYFEYGGTHEEALNDLTEAGFSDIIVGNEL